MFGSFNSFGQSSNSSPFGTQTPSLFGQTNNASSNLFATSTPFSAQTGSSIFGGTSTGVFGQTNNATSNLFATSTPFGAQQTRSSMFGGNSTGVFGAPQASSPFGSSSQALASSTPAPAFGGNSTFGGQQSFGFSTPQTNTFGSTSQQSQSAFGNSTFGPSTPFGTSSTPAFRTTSTPGFGVSSTPAFGSTAFGNSSTAFGNNAFSNNAFGSGGAFAASSSPAFGSGGAFAPSSSPAFGQSTSTFCPQSPVGGQGAQASTPLFGGQSTSGGQQVGSRVMTYAPTTEAEQGGSNQSAGKLVSLSAMAVYKNKTHEELRWEDYQRGDKGGQLPAGIGFGLTNSQFPPSPANPPNPFSSSTATTNPFAQNTPTTNTNFGAPFGQTPTTPFAQPTSTPSTNFASPFGQTPTTPFGQTTSTPSTSFASPFGQPTNTPSTNFTSPFGQPTNTPSTNFTSPFGQTTSTLSTNFSSPLGQSPTTPSMFGTSSTSTSVFAPSTGGFATPTTQPFGSSSTPAQGSTSAFNFGGNFNNSQTSPFGQSNTSSQFGQNTIPSLPQTNNFSTPSSTGFGTMYSSSSSLTTNNSPFGQITPATLTTYQPAPPAQTPGALAFNFSQPQLGGMATFSQCNNFMQVPASAKPAVMQPVPVTSPFGTLPALPQISIAQCGNSPSIQYGISSMPVVDKPAPVRISPLLTSRHLLQRRVKLPARKYRPGDDGPKVSFFSDEENANTPKADALFIPRENPRALFIRPVEKEKSAPPKNKPTPLQENGKSLNGVTNEVKHENKNNGEIRDAPPVKANQKPNGRHENHGVDKNGSNSSPSKVDIESIMPKLQHSEYFTEPRIQELAAKESVHPGYCKRVREFVVGRHGYGSIKFLGETDVCKLELEMLVQFNNREVIVYKDESQKPPVGEGLNKPAEVTLLNIKCMDKKSGKQVTEGSRLDKYKEMLKRKAEEQGAQFVSYDPVNGEWKFRVEHF